MNEEKEKKKTGKKVLLVLIPCLLAAVAAVAGIFLFRKPKTETDPSSDSETTYNGAVYWNVDGEKFFHDGTSNRKKEDDGYYHVTFLTENRQVSLRFADRALLNKADTRQAMGLVFDENHTVIDILDVEDFLGGIPYYNIYVQSFDNRKVKANFSTSGNGLNVDFEIPEKAPIYNVGGYYTGTYGEITNILYPTDQLVVLANKDGSIHSVYVVHREAGVDSNHRHCDCTEGTRAVAVSNGHVCEEQRYVPWNREDALPTETGYYYLNTDVMVAQASIKENQDVHLCLNGHTIHSVIDRRIYALFSEGCSLTITDCAEKPGSLLAHGSTDQGAVIWLRFGELTLFTGTYDASDIHTRNHPGACISLENNTHVTMYGGTLIGGHVTKGSNGGTVYVKNKASFDMFGGVMTDGFAELSAGGNLFVDNEAVFTAYSGAVIRNGNAQTGGNIASHLKGVVNLNGAIVENGVATAVKDPNTGKYSGGHGGNIAMAGTLNMNGGIIRNGKADVNGNGGGNLSVYTDNGKANLTSGTITGGVASAGGGGNILTFYKQTGAGPQVVLNNTTITDGKADGNGGNLCATAGIVALNGGTMKNGTAKIGGNIAISGDAAVTQNGGEVTGGKATTTGGNVNIAKGSFTLSGGNIVNGTADNGNGGNILVGPDSKLFVSNGTISGGKGCIGGNIYILAGGTAEVKGGTVKDGFASVKKEDDGKGGTKSSGGHGGNIACSGTLNILGGEILNGSIEEGGAGGGNISFVGKAAKLLMTGGKVSGGQSTESGGNMKAWYENPVLTITGGEISNGKCPNYGGNIWVGDDTVLTIDGVKITNGTANRGGNVYLSGRSKGLMTGGEVLGGNSTENGGNIYVALGTQFTLKNGTISGGNAAGDAGNIRVAGKMVMEGGLIADGISKGKTDIYGANLQMLGQSNTQETSLTMTGGEIKGWTYVRRLASKEDAVILKLSGSAKITGTGYAYESDFLDANVQIGALASDAEIVVKPNEKNLEKAFAKGVDGFTVDQAGKVRSSDVNYKVYTQTTDGIKLFFRSALDKEMCECGCTDAAACVHKETGHVCEALTYHAYSASTTALPTEGNYYLTQDITTSGSTLIGKGSTLRLDLNGHNVTFTKRGFSTYLGDNASSLIVSDSQGTGKVIAANESGATTQGNILWLYFGSATLYGGTFDATSMKSTTMQGAGICTESNSNLLTINGATILGGKSNYGGSIYLSSNTMLRMLSGTVKGGEATERGGNIYMKEYSEAELLGGTVEGGKAKRGGNVTVTSGSVLTIREALITGGNASENAGNVYVINGGKCTMESGTIRDGVAQNDAGNVRNDGIFVMKDGLITGGSAHGTKDNSGANFQMLGQSATVETSFTMEGGEITGRVYARRLASNENAVVVNLSGKAKISESGLFYDADMKAKNMVIGALEKEASLRIAPTASTLSQAFATGDTGFTKEMCEAIASTNAQYKVSAATEAGTLYLYFIEPTDRWQCECGCQDAENCTHKENGHVCKDVLYKAYTASTTTLPTSGNYYLTQDVTTSGSTLPGKGATLRLDLNGHTVTFTKRGFSTLNGDASTLVILSDSMGSGKMIAKNEGAANTQGNLFWLVQGKAILYGGTYDGSSMKSTSMQGAAFCTEANGGTLTIDGATILGGQAAYGGSISVAKNSTLRMLSGTVKGGSATERGGNVYFNDGAKGEILGGTIENGTAKRGGNIAIGGTAEVTMKGGVITGGHVTENAGNVYVITNGIFNLEGGTIKDGIADQDAGNVRNDGIMTMKGGLITGGSARSSKTNEAANVQMMGQNANTALTMTGGEIAGYASFRRLAASADNVFLKFSGDAKVSGTGMALNTDIAAKNLIFGALTDEAYIVVKPNANTNFATGKDGFTAAMVSRIILTDSGKKVTATPSGSDFILSFANK